MALGRRGNRGGGAEGSGRGRGGNNPFRGSNTRGDKANGNRPSIRPAFLRDLQPESLRSGSAPRGKGNARGGHSNIRDRGSNKT